MSSLFVLTFMFSTPAFCLGLLNPQWVGLGTRKRATALYGGLMAVSFLMVGVTAGMHITFVAALQEILPGLTPGWGKKRSFLRKILGSTHLLQLKTPVYRRRSAIANSRKKSWV
jgi:hypothetical protein